VSIPVPPVEAAMRTLHCDGCGALPGDPCTTLRGNRSAVSHADRFYAAHEAGLLPLPEAAS
jgi:hypothetical protein